MFDWLASSVEMSSSPMNLLVVGGVKTTGTWRLWPGGIIVSLVGNPAPGW